MKKTTTRKKATAARTKKKTTRTTAKARARANTRANTRTKAKTAKPARSRATARRGVAHAYQEGSVRSVGERATGTDRTDRSGDGTLAAQRSARRPARREEPRKDAFVSSEIGAQTSIRGRDPRTRS